MSKIESKKGKMLTQKDIKSLLSKNKTIAFVNVIDDDGFFGQDTAIFQNYFGEFKRSNLSSYVEVNNSLESIYDVLFTRDLTGEENPEEKSIYLFRGQGELKEFFAHIYCDLWVNGRFIGEHT